ncbi:hypothetical protein BC830DRAFT_1136739, partial [Chytriomyces sp. MP71]
MTLTSSCLLLILAVQSAYCHAVLVTPTARAGMAVDIGIKYVGNITNYIPDPNFPSCAGFPSGPIVQTFTAGSAVQITWNNTIPHMSAPGVTISVQYAPTAAFQILASNVDDTLQAFAVTLPAGMISQAAVLRWMWQSMEDGGFYIGCSDIAIAGGTANTQLAAPQTPPTQQAQMAQPAAGKQATTMGQKAAINNGAKKKQAKAQSQAQAAVPAAFGLTQR